MNSDLHKTFRDTFCRCPKMIKTKHKQIHKQTNKQIFLDHKYLSLIKSEHHKIFRETSCGCPTTIKTINKQINKQTNKNKHTNKHILNPICLS